MTSLTLFALVAFGASSASEAPAVFAVHIGVNNAPSNTSMPTLRYADDDALRFAALTAAFAEKSVLLAQLDRETQTLHPDAAQRTRPPRTDELSAALEQIGHAVAAAKERGRRTVVWFSYAGHGTREGGATRLTLADEDVGAAGVRESLSALGADEVHLFIDACHAEGVASVRGGPAGTAQTRALSDDEISATFAAPEAADAAFFAAHPNHGAIFAAGLDANTHEWSQIQSGVFTHEIVSGLMGLADVNLDGRITYSELCAFISAANRAVQDPRARVHVVAHPPQQNNRATLIDLRWLHPASFLVGRAPKDGRVRVDLQSGAAHAEAKLEAGSLYRIWLAEGTYRVEIGGESSPLRVRAGTIVNAETLAYVRAERLLARGPDTEALAEGLFGSAFGRRYYEGFADTGQWVPERFVSASVFAPEHFAPAPLIGPWLLFAGAAGAGGVLVVSTTVAVLSFVQFDRSTTQRAAVLSAGGVYAGALIAGLAVLATAALGVGAAVWWGLGGDDASALFAE